LTEFIHWTLIGCFALLGGGCVLLVIMQLPGTWAMMLLGLGVQCADAWWLADGHATAGWWALGIALVLALLGEIIETAAGVAGAKMGGGHKRGMWGSLIGAIGGALGGTFLIPIPLIGSLIGAIGGAFIGALIGETSGSKARSLAKAMKPAAGAAAGRAAGTIAKVAIAIAVWLTLIVGLAAN
jgi:uncharacterized protein YqgC (DUF456 family)